MNRIVSRSEGCRRLAGIEAVVVANGTLSTGLGVRRSSCPGRGIIGRFLTAFIHGRGKDPLKTLEAAAQITVKAFSQFVRHEKPE